MKIFWTEFAIRNLKDIFDYYSLNANKKVAHQIRNQILGLTKKLSDNPKIGQIEPHLNKFKFEYRYLVSGNYKIIYGISKNEVIISDVFDVRQNPTKMLDQTRLKK